MPAGGILLRAFLSLISAVIRRRTRVMTHRIVSILAACALLVSSANRASAQDFVMRFQNHRMTLIARDMSVSRILDRWSQIGGTIVVNGAAVQGGPISLQLDDVPEREALEILLRTVDGYIVAEREDESTGVSSISKILILRASTASRNQPQVSAVPAVFDRPAFVPAAEETFQPVPSSTPAGPQYVPPALLPVPVVVGTSRPGQSTPQAPSNFRPGQTPTGQPGQMAPMVNTIQQTGPGAVPPPSVVPGAE